jgi:D-serine deaminase-like pyridoxal phosphate-dependent protein
MNRTGIPPGEKAIKIFRLADSLPNLRAAGLHVYDGHIHATDLTLRQQICNDSFAPVKKMREDLSRSGFTNVRIIAGGTPTFPFHAAGKDVETSPGTLLLWDYGYSSSFTDMDFLHAAVLFARVVSKPAPDIICLDLGHKAVGSEMPQPRIMIPGFDEYTIIGHNEEHMVIRTLHAVYLNPGDPVYAIPWHICPTVDRYDSVYVVEGSRVTGQWNVEARKRQITF